jgi:hypothetical protein
MQIICCATRLPSQSLVDLLDLDSVLVSNRTHRDTKPKLTFKFLNLVEKKKQLITTIRMSLAQTEDRKPIFVFADDMLQIIELIKTEFKDISKIQSDDLRFQTGMTVYVVSD